MLILLDFCEYSLVVLLCTDCFTLRKALLVFVKNVCFKELVMFVTSKP